MKQWYFIVDVAKCENCNNCFLACKDEHVDNDWPGYAAPQPNHGQKWMNIKGRERGQYPLIDVAYLPMPCMHCGDAPCIKSAKNGGIYRRPDGIVIIDSIKAKDQKLILGTCPYGAIWWNEQHKLPQKCTLCAHLLDNGWTKPRCVQSCPTGAISVRNVEEAEMMDIIKKEGLEVYKPEHNTRPHVLYKNLYRYTRCFIGGSVATKIDGKEECVEWARVALSDKSGNQIDEIVTDNYGDFKFDNLPVNSGEYNIKVNYKDHPLQIVTIELKKSVNIGIVYV